MDHSTHKNANWRNLAHICQLHSKLIKRIIPQKQSGETSPAFVNFTHTIECIILPRYHAKAVHEIARACANQCNVLCRLA